MPTFQFSPDLITKKIKDQKNNELIRKYRKKLTVYKTRLATLNARHDF
jgi:hypothetical protein